MFDSATRRASILAGTAPRKSSHVSGRAGFHSMAGVAAAAAIETKVAMISRLGQRMRVLSHNIAPWPAT